jgi:hypothetical protein
VTRARPLGAGIPLEARAAALEARIRELYAGIDELADAWRETDTAEGAAIDDGIRRLRRASTTLLELRAAGIRKPKPSPSTPASDSVAADPTSLDPPVKLDPAEGDALTRQAIAGEEDQPDGEAIADANGDELERGADDVIAEPAAPAPL